ncbi:MAG: DegT/DnrJ/EryC1/StrS family aminotransferase [Syntrophobacteraceae bacterium]|nr:DegT/DnrJ/EryC1/StrS family aminotransferase [Syntrophobacteraceae bacterium]
MSRIEVSEVKLTEEEIQAAVDVLRSGNLRQNGQCEAFEREFASMVGAGHALTCANGTASLHLAYMSFLQPGDEVLVPSFTFMATGSMVAMSGGRPIFCDIDPETFLIDLGDAQRRITERTRAIAPVHLFGNPVDAEAVGEFAARNNLIVVWDAAQAHGASWGKRDVGSFGDFVCYSFYPSKNMFVGEGGMICTNNGDYAERMRLLRSHGESGKYCHTVLGFNYRMTDVEAAIGRRQLLRLEEMLAQRRANAHILSAGLAGLRGIRAQKISGQGTHAWHQYCVLVDPDEFGCSRDCLAERLQEKGVASGVHYPRGLHQQPVFEKLYGLSNLPVTEKTAQTILALPVHHGLTVDNAKAVVEAVRQCRG